MDVDGDEEESFFLVVTVQIPAVPAEAGESLVEVLRREGLPAVVDRSAAGEPGDIIQAWVLFTDDGVRIEAPRRPPGATVDASDDLMAMLESAGLSPLAVGGEPGGATDQGELAALLRPVEAPFTAALDAVTVVRADEVTLDTLARQEKTTLRVGSPVEGEPEVRIIRRATPGATSGLLPAAAFLEGAVTFLRFARRRGFVLAAAPAPIVGIWDRDVVVLDPTSDPFGAHDATIVSQVLDTFVPDPHQWDEAVGSLVADEATAQALRALLRETTSRDDSFHRLARLLGVPAEAATIAEKTVELPHARDVHPLRFRDILRREWRRTSTPGSGSKAQPRWATAWLAFTARHPVVRWTYTVVAGALGVAGVILNASTGQEWIRYLIPCLLLVIVIADALTPRPRPSESGVQGPVASSRDEGEGSVA